MPFGAAARNFCGGRGSDLVKGHALQIIKRAISSNSTANLRTKILDFRGFDSSRVFILRDGIPRPIVDLPESLSRVILAGTILVGRLAVRSGRSKQKN